MTEPSPELPTVPDLEKVLQAPVVTLLARASEVHLGDVIDSAHGLIHVREIVQRLHEWDLAGDPPGQLNALYLVPVVRSGFASEPSIRRRLLRTDLIRVRRAVTAFTSLKGHTKNVHSHAPVKRGWYTDPGGYDAECSCGWKAAEVYGSKPGAAYGWLGHKAGQLSEAAYADNSALLFLSTAEVVHRQLPPMPWTFKKISHGPRNGGGYAEASLDTLTVEQARTSLAAWRTLPGLTDVEFDEYRYDSRELPFREQRPGGTALELSANGPHKCHLRWTARIDDFAPGQIPSPQEVPGREDGPE